MDNGENNNTGLNAPDLIDFRKRRVKCTHCKKVVETSGDVCPLCGHYIYEKQVGYTPMSDKTTKKIKIALGIALIAVFIGLVLFGVIELKSCSTVTEILRSGKFVADKFWCLFG